MIRLALALAAMTALVVAVSVRTQAACSLSPPGEYWHPDDLYDELLQIGFVECCCYSNRIVGEPQNIGDPNPPGQSGCPCPSSYPQSNCVHQLFLMQNDIEDFSTEGLINKRIPETDPNTPATEQLEYAYDINKTYWQATCTCMWEGQPHTFSCITFVIEKAASYSCEDC